MKNNEVQHYTISALLTWEKVGSEVVVHHTTTNTTHRLDGEAARLFLAVAHGDSVRKTHEVTRLVELGLLESSSPIGRRTLVKGGAAGIGLGITSLTLPGVAAASSTQPVEEATEQAPTLREEAPPEPAVEEEPPPPAPSITAASLASGLWRWSMRTIGGVTSLRISPSAVEDGLPDNGIFAVDQEWTLTLQDSDLAPATATVVDDGFGQPPLTILFSFPLGSMSQPTPDTVFTGVLTSVDDTTVFSEPFLISVFTLD